MSSPNEKVIIKFDSVVLFSTADWDNPFWTNKQHMAVHLSECGFKVLYIESLGLRKVTVTSGDAFRIFKRIKRFFSGTKHVKKNIWTYSPLILPMHDKIWLAKLNEVLLKAQMSYHLWRLNFKSPLAWTYNPMVTKLVEKLKLKYLVYHSVDDLSAAPRLPKEKIEEQEKIILQKANWVFVTSLTLKEKYENWGRKKVYYYPNVADYKHFSKAVDMDLKCPEDLQNFKKPLIGFIGAISKYKLDFDMIIESAKVKSDWSWVLIGKVGEGDPETNADCLKRENIHLVGPKEYQDLPAYLKYFDAVIIPSPINEYTRSMFPMKFFEYLAAGKMIVSTDLPSLKEFKDYYLSARNSEEMVSALEKIISGQVRYTAQMQAVAQDFTWEKRMRQMFEDMGRDL